MLLPEFQLVAPFTGGTKNVTNQHNHRQTEEISNTENKLQWWEDLFHNKMTFQRLGTNFTGGGFVPY